MTYIAEIHRDNTATSQQSENWEASYHCALDCASQWVIGCDEAGDHIYCEASISGFLQRDVC